MKTLSIAEILSYGRPICDDPIPKNIRAEWFKSVCTNVCPSFKIDNANKHILNEIYRYTEGISDKLDSRKGLLLIGDIGTGKSTIMEIVSRYMRFTRGKDRGDYTIGGFCIESSSSIANNYSMKGKDALERYTYNNCNPVTVCFDEIGREPTPAKYFGTEVNVMQYIFQCRYELRHDCMTHATTNMAIGEIQQRYGAYIADRINEMFNVIEMKGASRR